MPPGNWEHKYRQLKARRNAIDLEIKKLQEAAAKGVRGATQKLTPLHKQRREVVAEMSKLIATHA